MWLMDSGEVSVMIHQNTYRDEWSTRILSNDLNQIGERGRSGIEQLLFGITWPEIDPSLTFQCKSGISGMRKKIVLDFLSKKGVTSFKEEGNPGKEASSGQSGGGKHFPAGKRGLPCLEHAPGWMPPTWACPVPPSSYSSRHIPPGHALSRCSSRHIPAPPAVDCFDPAREI